MEKILDRFLRYVAVDTKADPESTTQPSAARELNLPMTTVEKIVKDNRDNPEFVNLCDKKRDEFSEKASRIIDKALARLERTIDEEESIPVNQLTTAIGTLYDKRALSRGEITSNMAVTFTLPDEVSEYAE